MTNKEKYREEIENIIFSGSGSSFCVTKDGKIILCFSGTCKYCVFDSETETCSAMRYKWLTSEYVEPAKKKIDLPDDIAVDTPIFVNDDLEEPWLRRYFKSFRNGKVVTFDGGRTSWTDNGEASEWEYAKLPETGDIRNDK